MENDQEPALNKRQYFQMGLAGAIVAATLIAYIPAMRGGYIWDDDEYVTNNGTLRNAAGLWAIWMDREATPQYYPLVHTSFWLEYHLWGLDPLGYHVVNVLLHATGAVILWRVLLHLGVPGAYFIAAIFALHPVQVESVAWVTERKNVLSGVFYFSALWAYLRFNPLNTPQAPQRKQWGYYALTVAFFICALLSKTVTATLPAVIVVLLWWKRDRFPWRDLPLLVPFLILGTVGGAITAILERVRVRAVGPEWELSFLERLLVAGRALWFYVGKLTLPIDLTFIYHRWQIDAYAWWQYLYPIGAFAVIVAMWLLRRRIGKGPLAAVLIFAGTLFPALGFVNVYPMLYSFVADHFQYLAGIAFVALAVATCLRIGRGRLPRRTGTLAAGVVLMVLACLTWKQGGIYKDLESLWRDTLRKNEGCWMAHHNLSVLCRQQGRFEEAIAEGLIGEQLRPNDPLMYNSLGVTLAADGRVEAAILQHREALKLDPNFLMSRLNLGDCLLQVGRFEQAEAEYRKAATVLTRSAELQNNLGIALKAQNKLDQARDCFVKAMEQDSNDAAAHNNLAVVLLEKGDQEGAIGQLHETLRIQPRFPGASRNLARILAAQGRTEEALMHLAQACRVDPRDVEARLQLGLILQGRGRTGEAIAHLNEAVRLGPDSTPALNALAWVLATCPDASCRDGARALDLAQKACELTDWRSAGAMDTLAAAYAEAGKFDQAVETARKALDLAKSRQTPALVKGIQQHLDCYLALQPYREQPTTAPVNR